MNGIKSIRYNERILSAIETNLHIGLACYKNIDKIYFCYNENLGVMIEFKLIDKTDKMLAFYNKTGFIDEFSEDFKKELSKYPFTDLYISQVNESPRQVFNDFLNSLG